MTSIVNLLNINDITIEVRKFNYFIKILDKNENYQSFRIMGYQIYEQ